MNLTAIAYRLAGYVPIPWAWKQCLWRLMRWVHPVRRVTLTDGTRLHLDQWDGLHLSGREVEPGVRKVIRTVLQRYPRPVFIDVGANIGLHSAAVAQSCPHLRAIVSIEPNWRFHSALARNLEDIDQEQLYVFPVAVGPYGRIMRFAPRDGQSHLSAQGQDTVACVPLRVLLGGIPERPWVMKMDIEGGEIDALLSLDDRRWPDVLIVEYNPQALRRQGYDPGRLSLLLKIHYRAIEQIDDETGAVLPFEPGDEVVNLLCQTSYRLPNAP